MDRREFLRSAGVISAGLSFPITRKLFASSSASQEWRRFEVTTRVDVLKPSGATRIWLPAALIVETPFQRTIANRWECRGGSSTILEQTQDGLGIVTARFPAGVQPALTLTSVIAIRDYSVNLSAPTHAPQLSGAELEYHLRPTKLLPTDGIVRQTALEITRGQKSEFAKALCIYEWIIDNTFRDPKVRGCGVGNIRGLLESRNLGGKCADLNALFVGLARAAGLPARNVYGIRIAKSRLGYQSLGASTANVTKAQHCRAEVYLNGHGWVPVDPADVRKVVLEEPPSNRSLDNESVKQARTRLFGSWEMNWMAFNFAHDVALPGSDGPTLGFFMYPQAETAQGRLDSLDPENFRYEIMATELV